MATLIQMRKPLLPLSRPGFLEKLAQRQMTGLARKVMANERKRQLAALQAKNATKPKGWM